MSPRNDVPVPSAPRRSWIAPEVKNLPRLTELTLQSVLPIPGSGGTGSGGNTVVA